MRELSYGTELGLLLIAKAIVTARASTIAYRH